MTGTIVQTAEEASKYISDLVDAYPGIHEAWLFGSRANCSANSASDWDYMVFADQATLEKLRSHSRFNCTGIDLMIVTDGDHFASPWTEYSRSKTGRLAAVNGGWHWTRLSRTKAMYRARKPPDAAGCEARVLKQYALRVYPKLDEEVT